MKTQIEGNAACQGRLKLVLLHEIFITKRLFFISLEYYWANPSGAEVVDAHDVYKQALQRHGQQVRAKRSPVETLAPVCLSVISFSLSVVSATHRSIRSGDQNTS